MKYDIAIIGGGPGGYTAAEKAAKAGMQVVLFEQDHLGGTCLNRGCMPTKALLHSAETYAALEHAQTLGIQTQGVSYDFAAMHRRKDQVVETLRQGVEKLMKANKITVVSGSACIQRAGVIACHGETYEAEDIVIATGSKVSYPPIPGIDLPGSTTAGICWKGGGRRFPPGHHRRRCGGGWSAPPFTTAWAAKSPCWRRQTTSCPLWTGRLPSA